MLPGLVLVFLGAVFISESPAKEKKLVVDRDGVEIHLEPDEGSEVIASLQAGTELVLASDRKFKKAWNYVYFRTKKSAPLRSGYVHDHDVTRLYTNTTVATVQEKGRNSSSEREVHFRKTSWGMTKSQVMVSEGRGGQFIEKSGLTVLNYQENLLSQGCELNYIFIGNRLIGAKYRFTDPLENQDRIKNNFIQIHDVISRQYGPSAGKESENENNPHPLLLPEGFRKRLNGSFLRKASWTTPETEILLFLYQSEEEWVLDIEYLGIEYKSDLYFSLANSRAEIAADAELR